MTYAEKIKKAETYNIKVKYDFSNGNNVVGIYKFFYINGSERYCFYIGKSTDIGYRLFGASNGHIYMFINLLY